MSDSLIALDFSLLKSKKRLSVEDLRPTDREGDLCKKESIVSDASFLPGFLQEGLVEFNSVRFRVDQGLSHN